MKVPAASITCQALSFKTDVVEAREVVRLCRNHSCLIFHVIATCRTIIATQMPGMVLKWPQLSKNQHLVKFAGPRDFQMLMQAAVASLDGICTVTPLDTIPIPGLIEMVGT